VTPGYWADAIFALVFLLVIWETVKRLVATETTTRLERLPYAILRLARRRLPAGQREMIHDEEWLPELTVIVRETDGLPVTRMIRGINFAVGLLFTARQISRTLSNTRSRGANTTRINVAKAWIWRQYDKIPWLNRSVLITMRRADGAVATLMTPVPGRVPERRIEAFIGDLVAENHGFIASAANCEIRVLRGRRHAPAGLKARAPPTWWRIWPPAVGGSRTAEPPARGFRTRGDGNEHLDLTHFANRLRATAARPTRLAAATRPSGRLRRLDLPPDLLDPGVGPVRPGATG
jgi:hypothetical protein